MICPHCQYDFKEMNWEFLEGKIPCPNCGKKWMSAEEQTLMETDDR